MIKNNADIKKQYINYFHKVIWIINKIAKRKDIIIRNIIMIIFFAKKRDNIRIIKRNTTI